MRYLALLLLYLPACTTVREIGPDGKAHAVLMISSNAQGIAFRSARGTTFTAVKIDNAVVHTAIGNMVSKGTLSGGTAFATSGLGNVIK